MSVPLPLPLRLSLLLHLLPCFCPCPCSCHYLLFSQGCPRCNKRKECQNPAHLDLNGAPTSQYLLSVTVQAASVDQQPP